jgi:hypothetical protein
MYSFARLIQGRIANRPIAKSYRQRNRRQAFSDKSRYAKIFSAGRILSPAPNVTDTGRDDLASGNAMEGMMKRTLIRYTTSTAMADKNAELIANVFVELKAAKPEGVRYLSLRLDDDTFIHLVETAADDGSSILPKLAAFQAFQSGIRERCVEPPLVRAAKIVGNYRMLGEP